jgi:uncharacterized protein YfaS (alpha-2-macroglobulin family)
LLRADAHLDLANEAITFLIRNKDVSGTWHTTQATVLSLKALLLSAQKAAEGNDATVTVRLNGGQTQALRLTPDNAGVVQMVTFDDVAPGASNVVQLMLKGSATPFYQIAASYYLPWSRVPLELTKQQPVSIRVSYDRSTLRVNDTINVQVQVTLNETGTAQQALIDLGIPPGFEVLADSLQARIMRDRDLPAEDGSSRIERYELTGRQLLVYVRNLKSGMPLAFEYRLRARYPVVASVPPSAAYDYYNPQARGDQAPATVTVEQ